MASDTSRYPGLVPPTPRGHRSRCGLTGGAPGGEVQEQFQQMAPMAPPLGETPPLVDQPPASPYKNAKEDLNFGWFSVERGQAGTPAGRQSSRAGSRSSSVAGARGAGEPDIPGRSGSRQSGIGAGDLVRSASKASSIHEQGELTRSASRSSRMGQPARQDIQAQDGHIPGLYDPGPEAPPPPPMDDDIVIDWPMSSAYQAIMQQRQQQQEHTSYRPSSRTHATRCPSRSAAPATPLPPISWAGYRDARSRPTLRKPCQVGQGHQMQSDQVSQLMCQDLCGAPEMDRKAYSGQRRHMQYTPPVTSPRGCVPQGFVAQCNNNNTHVTGACVDGGMDALAVGEDDTLGGTGAGGINNSGGHDTNNNSNNNNNNNTNNSINNKSSDNTRSSSKSNYSESSNKPKNDQYSFGTIKNNNHNVAISTDNTGIKTTTLTTNDNIEVISSNIANSPNQKRNNYQHHDNIITNSKYEINSIMGSESDISNNNNNNNNKNNSNNHTDNNNGSNNSNSKTTDQLTSRSNNYSDNNNTMKRLLDAENNNESNYDSLITNGSACKPTSSNASYNRNNNFYLKKTKRSLMKKLFCQKPQSSGFYKPSKVVDWEDVKKETKQKKDDKKVKRTTVEAGEKNTKNPFRRVLVGFGDCLPILIHKFEKIRNKRKAFKFQKFENDIPQNQY